MLNVDFGIAPALSKQSKISIQQSTIKLMNLTNIIWNDPNEDLPDSDIQVLVTDVTGEYHIAYCSGCDWFYAKDDEHLPTVIEWWAELPEPPAEL